MQLPHTISVNITYSDISLSLLKWALNTLPDNVQVQPFVIPKGQLTIIANRPFRTQFTHSCTMKHCLLGSRFRSLTRGRPPFIFEFQNFRPKLTTFFPHSPTKFCCQCDVSHLCRACKPSPPLFFGIVTLFQLIIWSFFFSSVNPHNKFLQNLIQISMDSTEQNAPLHSVGGNG